MDAGHLTEDTDTDFEKEIKDEIETALNQSEKIGPPPVDTMFEDVLDEMPWHLEEQREELRSVLEPEIAEQKP
jgi:2-oxoisovalerate dehydrogenase E1 component alpha subunit